MFSQSKDHTRAGIGCCLWHIGVSLIFFSLILINHGEVIDEVGLKLNPFKPLEQDTCCWKAPFCKNFPEVVASSFVPTGCSLSFSFPPQVFTKQWVAHGESWPNLNLTWALYGVSCSVKAWEWCEKLNKQFLTDQNEDDFALILKRAFPAYA